MFLNDEEVVRRPYDSGYGGIPAAFRNFSGVQ